jgi:hypothetical protein
VGGWLKNAFESWPDIQVRLELALSNVAVL